MLIILRDVIIVLFDEFGQIAYIDICYKIEFVFGRFVASKFEEIFAKHALTNPHALTLDELKTFMKSNRERKDYGGWYVLLIIFDKFLCVIYSVV